MSAYIQSLDSITAQKVATTLQKTVEENDTPFSAFFESAVQLIKETNDLQSAAEAEALISELLTLKNPYHCPHGRPTIIAMSKRELEKKFKRIV